MLLLCLMLMVLSLAISWPLAWALIGAGHKLGQLDRPDDPALGGRKWHKQPTPNTGGIAIFWALAIPMLLSLTAVWSLPESFWSQWFSPLSVHLPGIRSQTFVALGVLGSLALVHGLGLVDDRVRLGPYLKLAIQLAIALTLASFFEIRVLEFLETWYGWPGWIISVTVSVLWMLAITNAMNFLDNMDGLSAGVGALACALFMATNVLGGQWFVAALCALLLGALLGFLWFNFPPAKLFMGDGGSLVLGLSLAIISIRTTYYGPTSPQALLQPSTHHPYALLTPLVILAMPLYDLTSVTLIRLLQGKNPMMGDRNHFSHRLVRRGLSQPAAVMLIWLCTLATGLGGIMLRTMEPWQACLIAVQVVCTLGVLALLERSAFNAGGSGGAGGNSGGK